MASNVLVFTYYWPPASGPGVQRFLKFCKFLPEFGWNPIVVSVQDGGYPNVDETLVKDIPNGLEVYKTKTAEPFSYYNALMGKKGKSVPVAMIGIRDNESVFQKFAKYVRANFFIPDARKGWKRFAVKQGLELIRDRKIDAIITTSPPHSTHLIGLELQRQTSIPWIADFRDPWTNIYYNKFLPRSGSTKKKDKALEDQVVQQADAVTVISPGLKDEFSDRNANIHLIYNGYDAEDIVDEEGQRSEHFSLGYIGNFKPNQDVPALWRAIAQLNEKIDGFKEQFQLHFTGNIDPGIAERLKSGQLSGQLKLSGFVQHREAVKIMQATNMLLFVIPQSEHNKLIMTGKIFEYLAAARPMLSVGPHDGDADRVIQAAERAGMINYADESSIASAIESAFLEWRSNDKQIAVVEKSGIEQFERRALSKQLADLLNQVKREH